MTDIDRGRDRARPDQLRSAARATGRAAQDLHDGMRWSQVASSAFHALPIAGVAATAYQAALGSISMALAAARDRHEMVAQALERVTDPIEDEQRARQRRQEARQDLDEAREERSRAVSELGAAQTALSAARQAVAALQAKIAQAQAANAARIAAGDGPVPVDHSGLAAAQQQLVRSEQLVYRAEQRMSRASDRLQQARHRFVLARRRHQEAKDSREEAVRAFRMVLALAGVLPPLPAFPGKSPNSGCPTDNEHLHNSLKGVGDGSSMAGLLRSNPHGGLLSLVGMASNAGAGRLAEVVGVCKPFPVPEPPVPPDGGGPSLFGQVVKAPVSVAKGVGKGVSTASRIAHGGLLTINYALEAGNRAIDGAVAELDEFLRRNPPPPYPLPLPPGRKALGPP